MDRSHGCCDEGVSVHASPAYTETQLEALAGGEPAAFEQFYRDHHARIYNLVARVVGDPDITQEVFLRAYTHPIQAGGDLRPEPWLYRIAVNASYDHLRRRAARPSTSLDTVAEIPDTGDGFVDGELTHCIETCLAGLTPRYRTALVLKDLHGLSHAEIAEVMDIHQGAARVLLHRARAAFRRSFRSTAPTGAGGVTMLGLAAFLPELPVPASLQTPPPFASLAPQAAWPAASAPHLASAAPGAGQAGLSGATSAASAPMAAAPAVSLPLAVAPITPVGLLAGLGGAAGIKVAIAVVAVAVVAGGGLAARHGALGATSVDAPAGHVTPGVTTTSQIRQSVGEPKSYRQLIGEQLRVVGSYRGDRDGGGTAAATRKGTGSGGATTGGAAGGTATGGSGTGALGEGSGSGAAGQGTGADHNDGTSSPGTSAGGGTTGGGTTGGGTTGGGTTSGGTTGGGTGGGDTTGGGTGSGGDPTSDGGGTGSGGGGG
jgi:RNA polymerase sigma factor (sigma-70 family)